MLRKLSCALMLAGALGAAASGQTIVNNVPGAFTDISTTGGTAILGVGDDTSHLINTTVGNALFPAGAITVGNNGAVCGAGSAGGYITFGNTAIGATGVPGALPSGNGILLPFWGDMYPVGGFNNNTTIYWQELSGVLYIMWKNEEHFGYAGQGQVTFEVQVYGNPGAGPWIQYVYPDTTFAAPPATVAINNNGLTSTVGYVKGTNTFGNNVQWSFNTASVPDGTVLSIFPPVNFTFTTSGSGTVGFTITSGPPNGTYFMPISLSAGSYPNGWFFGIDLPLAVLALEINAGFPFVGSLDGTGGISFGPVGGLPSMVSLYGVVLVTPSGGSVPTIHTPPATITIP